MDRSKWRAAWKEEEARAHIQGWDFSHIQGRFEEERDLPWNYRELVREYLREDMDLLDCDTGGGEFLRSLGHPADRTAATEGWPPNVKLCREVLTPLGVDFRECADPSAVPFPGEAFDIILNRHGAFDPAELFRLLKPGGVFLTEQVGEDNERDLVERVLPGTPKPFPHKNLREQRAAFEAAGFQILRGEEAFRPIFFYDVGAFVWFARVIEWEFPGFSVDRCFDRLCAMQEEIEAEGAVRGTIHRYLLIAKKEGRRRPGPWTS
ncbi:class I SAM-dependent methyltransferase [Oscillibacter sp.]|uniref:class I SAM-dependent methyltransferase n=1 Tax=Oscillibacter sp. TaxID=1945593 RepID=UPI002D807BA5|nr:class I SAM-dependent methyltransferase [Oscillibacter sp.]